MERVSKAFWLWCQFADTDMEFLRNIQSQVNKKFQGPKFEIHLTLLGPIMIIDKERVRTVRQKCDKLNPFKVYPLGYSFSSSFFTSLFIEIKKSKNLSNFRKEFSDISPLGLRTNYMPHVSLMYGNFQKDEKRKLITNLLGLRKSFTIDKVCIVDVNEDNFVWKITNRFNL